MNLAFALKKEIIFTLPHSGKSKKGCFTPALKKSKRGQENKSCARSAQAFKFFFLKKNLQKLERGVKAAPTPIEERKTRQPFLKFGTSLVVASAASEGTVSCKTLLGLADSLSGQEKATPKVAGIGSNQYFISDFVDIQRKSFFTLLEKGLIEEFSKRNPITNLNKTMELFFYPEYYQLTPPEYSPTQAIIKSKSYTSRLYIPVQLTDKTTNTIKLKWVYIGNIPLMTKRGHFILNGCARVIVNQMIRSPGIYYQKKIYENYPDKWSEKPDNIFERYYADLICNRGTWLRIEVGKDNQIWAQMKRVPKIPIMWLLIAMGLSEKMILKRVTDSQMLLYNFLPISDGDSGLLQNTEANDKIETVKATPGGEKVSSVSSLRSKNLPYVKTPPAAWAAIYNLVKKRQKKTKKTDKSNKNANISQIQNQKSSLGGELLKFERAFPAKATAATAVQELGRKWVFNKFMNPRTYDLGPIGRMNFNNKLNLSIDKNQTTLTPQDLLLATDYLILVSKGLRELDDIDHLKNRRVRTSGELIQLQIGIGLVRLEKSIREKMNKVHTQMKKYGQLSLPAPSQHKEGALTALKQRATRAGKGSSPTNSISNGSLTTEQRGFRNKWDNFRWPNQRVKKSSSVTSVAGQENKTLLQKQLAFQAALTSEKFTISQIMNTKPFNGALKEFFGSNPLSQFMDQINPLAELTHKRRLSSMGPGGVTRDSATLEIRGIHPSHYGRICPVETPEGKNTGLVNSLTAYARVNANGYIETPFYRVYKGQVQKKSGLFFFSAKQEEKIKLGASDLSTSDIGFLPLASIPVRIVEDFTKISRKELQYVGVAPIQMISIATSLIPFFEHDDGNRALMGSNMQRQAVPILKPQRPIVGTGLEAKTVSDSGHVVQAQYSGVVTYVSASEIQIYQSPF